MHKIVKTGDFSGTLERAGCKQPKSTRLLPEFRGDFFLHWDILMNEDSDDSLTNILKEEEQQQLQQVGGHGAQDKAQAMQVSSRQTNSQQTEQETND